MQLWHKIKLLFFHVRCGLDTLFGYRYAVHFHRFGKRGRHLIPDVARQVFRGGVYGIERGDIIDIGVIKRLESLFQKCLEIAKVHEKFRVLRERIPFDDHFDGVVMTVEVLALSFIMPKGVRGAKFGTNRKLPKRSRHGIPFFLYVIG